MKQRRGSPVRTHALVDDPQWYKDAVIYELRVRSFNDSNGDGIGDFRGLLEKLDYLQDLGVTAIWLLPFYPSPLRDDGYDIADYFDVHPDVGTLEDFKRVLDEAHKRGMRVITELVLNHTSDQHPWFLRARRAPAGSVERDFYVWSETTERYKDTRIIFKDFEPSNWAWDPVARSYFWHRFYSHQPDLNFDNLAVHEAVMKVVDFWLELGVDGLRLDAVPYLYEREGTNCENLPETHAFLRKLREHIDARFKNRMLLAEANQWPEDAAAYFGRGDECHMNFHFPIMPRLFMAIHMEDRLPIIDILAQTPMLEQSCQWALFLRNHDELTLEMVTDDERDYMYRAYASDPTARINLGIRRRLAPLVGNDRRNIELMNGLLFSLPGTPVLYYGDEIGMGDNVYLGDRNGVRTPMQWSADRNAGFSRANPQRLILPIIIDPEYHFESVNVEAQQANANSLLWWTKRLIAMRGRFKAFGRGGIEFLSPDNPRVLAFVRQWEDETVLVVANLSRFAQFVELDLSQFKGMQPVELFGNTRFPAIGELPYLLTLGGHGFYWFSLERAWGSDVEAKAASYVPPTLDVAGGWEQLLVGRERALLEGVLPAWLEGRRWFVPGERSVSGVRLLDALPTGGEDGVQLGVVRVDHAGGSPDSYVVPFAFAGGDKAQEVRQRSPLSLIAHVRTRAGEGVLYDAFADPPSSLALVDAIARGEQRRSDYGLVQGSAWGPLSSVGPDGRPLDVRVPKGDPGQRTVLLGDQYVVRLYRRLDDGVSPDVEVGRFLAEKGRLAAVPPMLGALEYRVGRGEPITLASVQQYAPHESDGIGWAREELTRYFERALARPTDLPLPEVPTGSVVQRAELEPPQEMRLLIGPALEVAALLGERTAELHLALSSDPGAPAFAPEPYTALDHRSSYQSMRNRTGRMLRLVRSRLGTLDEAERALAKELLAREEKIYQRLGDVLRQRQTATRGRYHGDLHLGRVLYTGKDVLFIGLEGDRNRPLWERRRKRWPMRDVAGMVRSLSLAASNTLYDSAAVREGDQDAAQPWAVLWHAWTSAVYLRSYLARAGSAAFVPHSREEMDVALQAILIEKALRDVGQVLEEGRGDLASTLRATVRLIDREG